MDDIAEFLEDWVHQGTRGFRYLTEWQSVDDFAAWLAQILPPPWRFEIQGQMVGLSEYLGENGVYYQSLSDLTMFLGMADYVIDVRLFLLCLHIGLAARILVFGMEHWSFIANWRRGRQ